MKKQVKKFNSGGEMYRKNAPPIDAIESVYPLEEALLGGPVGKVLGRVARPVVNKIDMVRRPKVANEIVTSKGISTKSNPVRMPKDEASVTHGYRNMSPAELESAKKSGYLTANPANKYAEGKKWWSSGDTEGSFGRSWKSGDDAVTVRVPKDKIPSKRAVSKKDLEVLNKDTGTYEKFKKGGTVKSKPTASSRGDGCIQRGKTKGKMR